MNTTNFGSRKQYFQILLKLFFSQGQIPYFGYLDFFFILSLPDTMCRIPSSALASKFIAARLLKALDLWVKNSP